MMQNIPGLVPGAFPQGATGPPYPPPPHPPSGLPMPGGPSNGNGNGNGMQPQPQKHGGKPYPAPPAPIHRVGNGYHSDQQEQEHVVPVYKGWIIRKVNESELSDIDAKPTWRICHRTEMPFTQEELMSRVKKRQEKNQRKERSVSNDYNELPSFYQREQIDRLISEQKAAETNSLVDWNLVSIETATKQISYRAIQVIRVEVILKRQVKPEATVINSRVKFPGSGNYVDLRDPASPVHDPRMVSRGPQVNVPPPAAHTAGRGSNVLPPPPPPPPQTQWQPPNGPQNVPPPNTGMPHQMPQGHPTPSAPPPPPPPPAQMVPQAPPPPMPQGVKGPIPPQNMPHMQQMPHPSGMSMKPPAMPPAGMGPPNMAPPLQGGGNQQLPPLQIPNQGKPVKKSKAPIAEVVEEVSDSWDDTDEDGGHHRHSRQTERVSRSGKSRAHRSTSQGRGKRHGSHGRRSDSRTRYTLHRSSIPLKVHHKVVNWTDHSDGASEFDTIDSHCSSAQTPPSPRTPIDDDYFSFPPNQKAGHYNAWSRMHHRPLPNTSMYRDFGKTLVLEPSEDFLDDRESDIIVNQTKHYSPHHHQYRHHNSMRGYETERPFLPGRSHTYDYPHRDDALAHSMGRMRLSHSPSQHAHPSATSYQRARHQWEQTANDATGRSRVGQRHRNDLSFDWDREDRIPEFQPVYREVRYLDGRGRTQSYS